MAVEKYEVPVGGLVLWLESFRENAGARTLYEKMGYAAIPDFEQTFQRGMTIPPYLTFVKNFVS